MNSLQVEFNFSSDIQTNYLQQNPDLTPVLSSVLQAGNKLNTYFSVFSPVPQSAAINNFNGNRLKLLITTFKRFSLPGTPRILIYNGDASLSNNFLGTQWFIDGLAKTMGLGSTERIPWNYTMASDQPFSFTFQMQSLIDFFSV